MVSVIQALLRVGQFVCIIIATSLVGNAIARQIFGNSTVNYSMFAAVFAWIALLFGLAAAFVESLAIKFVLIPMDALAMLFTWIAGVVLAARLHVHSCSNFGYVLSNTLTQGSQGRCRELQAACAFFWFAFALFAGSLIMDVFSGGSSMSMRRRGAAGKPGPTMSQV